VRKEAARVAGDVDGHITRSGHDRTDIAHKAFLDRRVSQISRHSLPQRRFDRSRRSISCKQEKPKLDDQREQEEEHSYGHDPLDDVRTIF
jgi:hypothetical protein